MALLTQKQIEAMGFAAVGKDIRISDRASFYGCSRISLGNHVRIDDFCVLSSGTDGITIGSHIHIAAYTSLIGSGWINLQDYCGLSSRVSIYSSSDDYSGDFMTNPMVPTEYTNVTHAPVTIGRHVIIGSGSVVLPGVTLHEGVAIGALSLVSRDCAAFGIYAGQPAKRVKERGRQLLTYETRLQNMLSP